MGMMDYLKTVVALFLATAVTASAVQLDGYEVTNSDGEVVKSMADTDTSNFTSLDEYENLIENHIDVPASSGSPYGWNGAHPNRNAEPMQSVLNEIIDRGMAEPYQLAELLAYNVRKVGPGWIDKLSTTIDNLAAIDVTQADKTNVLFKYSAAGSVTLAANIILQHSDSSNARNAFDALRAYVDKFHDTDVFPDTDSADYDLIRARDYHIPLGNYQQAYDISFKLAQEGYALGGILNLAVNTDMPATEELLWEVVDSVSTDWYNGSRISNMVTIWNDEIDWNSYTPQEALDICNKYLMAVTVNETTAPFITAVKEKRRTMEDMVD